MSQFAVAGAVDERPVNTPAQAWKAPVSRMAAFRANANAQVGLYNTDARMEGARQDLMARHREIERLTGKKLPWSTFMQQGEESFAQTGGMADNDLGTAPDQETLERQLGLRPAGALDEAAYEAQIDKLREQFPREMAGVRNRAQLDAERDKRFMGMARAADEGMEAHPVAGFAGSLFGSIPDPVNQLTTVLTGGLGASRGLAMRALMQGGANAGQEVLLAPEKVADARYGGPKPTVGSLATDAVTAGVGGAGFELGGAALGKVWRGLRPPRETAAARAVQVLDDADLVDQAIGARGGEDHGAASAALDRVEIPALEPSRGLDDLFPDDTAAGGPRKVDYRGRTIWADSFDPRQLEVDPATFQYKADGDAQGVTARLKGVEAWDPTSSGKVIVYERADGTRVIADGHQRRGLALRMEDAGWDARLDGYLMREADGWTGPEVRVVAALKNIREGSGSILDAAKVFRTAPSAIKDGSLPVTGDFIGQARGLAQLSPEAFGAVVNKVIPERYGADIGLMAGDRPDLHRDMVALLHKGEPANGDEARALIAEALQDDWFKTQGDTIDLFGHDPSVSGMIARAKVAAAVKRGLGRDARLYGQLVKHADAIEAGGNALARDANEAQLALDRAALEVTSRLAMRSGPIGEAMAEAAAKVSGGESPATAAKGVLARVRAALKAGEALDEARGAVIDPPATPEAARGDAAPFGDPYGPAAEGQARAKPEHADLEAGDAPAGLFDDLPPVDAYEKAHKALTPCAAA